MSTRSEKMKARMADPAFRAKAMENLARGRAARDAKRAGKKSGDVAGAELRAAIARDGASAIVEPSPSPAPATRRAFGIGRWRES